MTTTIYLTHLPEGQGLYFLVTVEEGEDFGQRGESVPPGQPFGGAPYDAWAALPDGEVRLGATGPEAVGA